MLSKYSFQRKQVQFFFRFVHLIFNQIQGATQQQKLITFHSITYRYTKDYIQYSQLRNTSTNSTSLVG